MDVMVRHRTEKVDSEMHAARKSLPTCLMEGKLRISTMGGGVVVVMVRVKMGRACWRGTEWRDWGIGGLHSQNSFFSPRFIRVVLFS